MRRKKSRLMAGVTALVMLLCMGAGFALPTFAKGQIEIASAEQLMAIAYGGLDGNYIQKADIDLSDKAFLPIGSLSAPFIGTYDGNGYKIDGLKLSSNQQFQGLFGVNNGTIRNVTLGANCFIEGSAFVGAIAGRNNGVIEDCISDAKVTHRGGREQEVASYTVLSQNLCQWGDDSLADSSSYQDSMSNSRRPSMLQRIFNIQPDIMFFQEVSFSGRTRPNGKYISGWDEYLKNVLGSEYTFVGDYRDESEANKEGVTVAYNDEKFTCLRSGMFWLSDNPDAPRYQQTKAWGASCVRTCAWVLLEDNDSHELVAAYSVHLDHPEEKPLPRENGAKVVKTKMEELRAEFPDALFIVGGDYNEDPGDNGYNVTVESFDGMIDDTRYAVEDESIEEHTWEGNFVSFEGATRTIDYIFADSSKVEVNSYQILKDYYRNLRPSDHHGVLAQVERLQNNGIGGITGSNGGTVRRVIAIGTVDGPSAEAVGQAIGSNASFAENIYAPNVQEAIGSGVMKGVEALPQTPEISVVADLNKEAGRGAFTIVDDEYVLVGERDLKIPTRLTINGVDRVVYAGEIYTLEELGLDEDAILFFNGSLVEGDSITIPEEGGVIKEAVSVSLVDRPVSSEDYAVGSMADWMYLYEYKDLFADRDVAIHLLCDLDFSLEEAAEFTTMENPAFSFDGHGNTIRNWGTKDNPVNQIGFFSVNEGAGGLNYIKNVNFENCHIWDNDTTGTNGICSGTTLVYSVMHGNAGLEGLPTEVTIENVHVSKCSLGANTTEANAFILSRYGVPGKKINVYIRGCSVEDSVLDANNMDHKGLILGKARCNNSQTASNQANFYIEDCIVRGNEIKNSKGRTGFVLGNIEAYGVDAYVKNVGIFNNTSSGTNDGGIIGYMDNGGIVCKGVLMQGNILNHDKKYVIAAVNTPVNVVTNAIYCDNTDLTGMVEAKSNTLTGGADMVASGEAGFAINKAVEVASFRWLPDGKGGYITTTEDLPEYCKVVIRVGGTETTQYVPKGTTITLPTLSSGEYIFVEGEGTIVDDQLVVNMDIVLSKAGSVESVGSAVNSGDYNVATVEEWMYLYRNKEFFKNRNITIHLRANLDLSESVAADFTGFWDPYFSFDGHGYTIKNWGTKDSPVASKGLFLACNGAGGLNYIKNITLENCHLTDYEELSFGTEKKEGNNALVYSAIQDNEGLSGLPAELTLENITIKDCSLITIEESCALLLGRYAPSGSHTVNFKNIRVEGSTLDAGNSDHKGLLVGKPRYGNGGSAIFNIRDCYLYANTITNGNDKSVGLIFGTCESNNTTTNLENIGVVGNRMEKSGNAALVGFSGSGGKINIKKMIFADNNVTAANTYLVAYKSSLDTITIEDVYSDETGLAATVMGGKYSHTVAADKIRSGEIGYNLNKKLEEPSFYWGMKNNQPIPVEEANQIAKLSLVDEDRIPVETFYLNGGSQMTFADSEKDYKILTVSGGSLSGATLTMPEGGKDVVVQMIDPSCDHHYDEANAYPYGANRHKIPCSNDCGLEEIINCPFDTISCEDGSHYEKCEICGNQKEAVACTFSYQPKEGDVHIRKCGICGYETAEEGCIFGDWSPSEKEGEHTHAGRCRCGNVDEANCPLEFVKNGDETHVEQCITCGYKGKSAPCVMRADAKNLPAIGECFRGAFACASGCGNAQANVWLMAGDVDNDGKVGLADVIMILRVAVGLRPLESIHGDLANAYQDGTPENAGITTGDAILLLRYLLQK